MEGPTLNLRHPTGKPCPKHKSHTGLPPRPRALWTCISNKVLVNSTRRPFLTQDNVAVKDHTAKIWVDGHGQLSM